MELNPNNAEPAPSVKPAEKKAPEKDTYEKSAEVRESISSRFNGKLPPNALSAAEDALKYLDGVKENRASGVTKEQAIKAESKASEVLSKHEAERFREMVDELDPSFEELDNAAKDFNKRAKELGVTDVVNDNNLTQEEKDAKISKIFEENPDFKQSRDHLIKSQDKYRRLTAGIHYTLNKHNDQVPKGSHVNRQDLQNKMKKEPTEPEKGVDSVVDKIALLIYATIKKVFDRMFRRNRQQEVGGPNQDQNEIRHSSEHSAPPKAPPKAHGGGMSGPK